MISFCIHILQLKKIGIKLYTYGLFTRYRLVGNKVFAQIDSFNVYKNCMRKLKQKVKESQKEYGKNKISYLLSKRTMVRIGAV